MKFVKSFDVAIAEFVEQDTPLGCWKFDSCDSFRFGEIRVAHPDFIVASIAP